METKSTKNTLLFCLLFFTQTLSLYAKHTVPPAYALSETVGSVPILLSDYILLAKNPELTEKGFPVSSTVFTPVKKGTEIIPGVDYWIKLQMQDTVDHPLFWIGFGKHHIVDLYHNKKRIGRAGDGINQDAAIHRSHRLWIPLPEAEDENIEYLVRLQPDQLGGTQPLIPRLATLDLLDKQRFQTIHDQQKKYAFYWSMMVIIGFLALVSFAQYCFNKDRTYLFYGFYLSFNFIYLLFTFERNSVYCIFLKKYLAGYQHALIIPTLMMSYYFYTQFSRHILNTKVVNMAFDKLLRYFGRTTLFFLVLDIIFGLVLKTDNYPLLRNLMLTGTFLFATGCLISLFGIKNQIATFIFAGTLIFSIGSFLGFLFTTLITLPAHLGIWSDGYAFMQIGVLAEVLCFSVALAYRSHQMEEDKNLATAQLIRENYEKEKFRYENKNRKEFERVRSQFFADTNHELRTPLTIIKGTAELLDEDNDKRETILRNTHSMIDLLNNMLQLSKLEMGKTKVQNIQGDIISFLAEHIQVWFHYAEQQGITLEFHQPEAAVVMDFDDKKILQILNNLLSNAIKFTPRDGLVSIHADAKEDQFILSVADTGIGIAPADLPHVFDRYFQTAQQSPSDVEGTGIGLSLVHQLVQLMEGTIAVMSHPEEGTCFEIAFPITQNSPIVKSQIAVDQPTRPPQSLSSKRSETDSSRPSVLLVEDQPELLQYLETALQEDYRTITATNGEAGIELAKQLLPDLIISDVVMPKTSGFELCKILKDNFDTSHIPIILLTARVGEADRMKGLERGADAYLTKPFSRSELMLRIQNLIHVRKLLQLRISAEERDQESEHPVEISPHDKAFLESLRSYIRANLSTGKLEVSHLQQATNTSRSTLHRKLTALTGLSTSQFKKQVRMLEAKRLLATREYTISELAYHLGYTHPGNFTKDFKEYFGIAPSAYNDQ